MRKFLNTLAFSLMMAGLFATSIRASEFQEELTLRDRLFFGGNFGLQLGTVTNIEVSPIIGYKVTPRLSGGLGIRYEYYKDSRNIPGYMPFETNILGGSLFSRYILIQNIEEVIGLGLNASILAQAEFEVLSLEKQYFEVPSTLDEGRFPLHSVLLGGGLYQPVGRRSGLVLMVLWNLNQTASSPYSNPIIRLGFNF